MDFSFIWPKKNILDILKKNFTLFFMALVRLPLVFSIPFMKYKSLPLYLMVVMLSLFGIGLGFRGINWGVDFQGGLMTEVVLEEKGDLNMLRRDLHRATGKEISLQAMGKGDQQLMIRIERDPKEEGSGALVDIIKKTIGPKAHIRKTELIGPKVGKELIRNGCFAIFFALLGIMAFVWFRFEWQFSVCTLVALIHDCFGILAFFMLTGLEFNESAIVAILITASYSVNDTVVIFDRLRENFSKESPKVLENKDPQYQENVLVSVLNKSLNETMTRTILTSSTAILALLMMYLFGGEIVSSFSLPILVGIAIGAYSSVVIAVPLLRFLPIPHSFGKSEDSQEINMMAS